MQTIESNELAARARILRRPFERGVTLVEVLIVVAIIAMVAGGVVVFALPQFRKAQLKTAATGAAAVRAAAQQWKIDNPDCPSLSQLVEDKMLDSNQSVKDPWDSDFTVSCTEDDDVVVTSPGPDKKLSTPDDIVVPKGATGSDEEG